MSIAILQGSNGYPAHTVHLGKYKAEKEADLHTLEKVWACTRRAFHLISIFFISFKDPARKNLGSADHSVFLKGFASDELDVDHIKTEELELDASAVPEDITVDTLASIFDKINFTNPRAPGYMANSTRRGFTPGQLKAQLRTFIERVNRREPFLGTPPSHDVPRLMDFYKQIEDAVRLCIQKVIKDVDEFVQQNGTDPSRFNAKQKKEYATLLGTQARLALDLAIAGGHCGARYMGEAMEAYYILYGQGLQSNKDLQGTLIEILAEKRKEIARGQIQTYLGENTHAFANYMGNMGQLIGIPGTKNIIEQISLNFDTYLYLERVFQAYNADVIIDTVQETIKKSQSFREKITDWIRDQVEDWNREQYEGEVDTIVRQIIEIRDSSGSEETPLTRSFEILQNVLTDLKNEKTPLPETKEGWDSFITELFALNQVKEKLDRVFDKEVGENATQNAPLEKMRWRHKLKQSCSEQMLGSELSKALLMEVAKESAIFTPISPDQYLIKFNQKEKIAKMKSILPLEEDTLSRLLTGQISLEETVKSYQEQARRNAFLECFNLEEDLEAMVDKGLSKKLIEWILVSQKILTPQTITETVSQEININQTQSKSYADVVYREFSSNPKTPVEAKKLLSSEAFYGLLSTENDRYREIAEKIAVYADSKKRYTYDNTHSKTEKALTWIFNQSFQNNPNHVITAAQKANGEKEVFYPKWKEVCLIQLPKISSNLLSNPFFKVALVVSTIAIYIFSICLTTIGMSFFLALKVLPLIDPIMKIKNPILRNFFIFIMVFCLKSIWKLGVKITEGVVKGARNMSQKVSHKRRKMFQDLEKERLTICKQRSLDVWKACQLA